MQRNVNPRKLQILAGVWLAVSAASMAWAQTAPALQSATGTVTKVDAAARSATIKTDAGQEFAVTLDTKATVRRIPAGETDLTKATVIQIGDVAVGDRVQARGKIDGQSVTATQVWVMASSEVAKTQQAQQADWDKRGVSGLVTAVSGDSVTIGVRNLNGVKPMVITLGPGAIVRKYAPDSVSFAEAKTAALGDIKVGDQVRARGDKNEDSSKMAAVEIVSGTFKTMAGVILSIDAANNQMQVRDLDTKKPVTVKINRESSVKKLQPQLSQAIATRLHARSGGGWRCRGRARTKRRRARAGRRWRRSPGERGFAADDRQQPQCYVGGDEGRRRDRGFKHGGRYRRAGHGNQTTGRRGTDSHQAGYARNVASRVEPGRAGRRGRLARRQKHK